MNFPWPPKECSPNARCHWSKKAKAAKAYKQTCWALAKEAKGVIEFDGEIHLWITFFPPDKRIRDDDNLIASFKNGRDGLAMALGVDDSRFRLHPWVSTEVVKGGSVSVRITAGPTS